MPQDNFKDGFTGAFTWGNIGTQVANGIISGGASFAIGMLLTSLTQQNENMGEMFQKFSDQIVERLSAKMKEIVATAFYQNSMNELLNESEALEVEYRAFLTVGETNLLNDIEEKSFNINQKATSLKIPAIGIYCVQKTIQIAIFLEKSKTNPQYKNLIIDEIVNAESHLDSLHKEGIEQINAAFSYKHKSQYDNQGELVASWSEIYYEDVLIERVTTYLLTRGDIENFTKVNEFLKNQKYSQFENDVYNPAKVIVDKLKLTSGDNIPKDPFLLSDLERSAEFSTISYE